MSRAPIRLFLLGVLFVVATAAAAQSPRSHSARAHGEFDAAGGWTFQGCWKPNTNSGCLDIFTDSSGNYYICKPCGTTRNPSGGKCNPTTIEFLNTRGLWCS